MSGASSVDVEGGICLGANKAKGFEFVVQSLIPHTTSLFETIEQLSEMQDIARIAKVIPFWLLHVDLLAEYCYMSHGTFISLISLARIIFTP